jgi:hypothetical protein
VIHPFSIVAHLLAATLLTISFPEPLMAASVDTEYLCCLQPRGPEPRNLNCHELSLTPDRCRQVLAEHGSRRGSAVAESSAPIDPKRMASDRADYLCCTEANNPRNKNLNCAARPLTPSRCVEVMNRSDAGTAKGSINDPPGGE